MTPAELQKILQSEDKLTVKQVKEIIWQLKNDCFVKVSELKNKQREREVINLGEWGVEHIESSLNPYLEEKFYYGETNAFYICLDLLEKVEEDDEK